MFDPNLHKTTKEENYKVFPVILILGLLLISFYLLITNGQDILALIVLFGIFPLIVYSERNVL